MDPSSQLPNFKAEDFVEGQVLLIDKPLEWTSFQAVNKIRHSIRYNFGIKKIKVGHAGTLDPLATGLLIICTGRKTKEIETFMGKEKEYEGRFHIGATTPSYDLETEIDQQFPTDHIDEQLLREKAASLTGEIEQVPPIFSAIKIKGEKAYDLAREGQKPELKSRKIHVHSFELLSTELPEIAFRIRCSKGTYIRSLANDFGKALGSGAYLSALRRTKIGDFDVSNGIGPLEFANHLEKIGTRSQSK